MTEWSSPTSDVAAWVESLVGPVETIEHGKVRPWAIVWEVTTADGVYWAKQNSPGQTFEAELVAVLAELAPSYVVPVVGVDVERGLLLTPDQGAVLGETVADDDLDVWVRLVVRAMELSRLVADEGAALLATGLTRSRVPGDVVDLVAPWQQELDALGLPESLNHNDLHEYNAFDLPDGMRFFDFADAVGATPSRR